MANAPGRRQKCTAHSKRTGAPCGNWAVAGRNVCRMHGGRAGAPQGNDNALKTGLHAEKTLTRWEEFEQACEEAPLDHRTMRETQAKRNHARIRFMYQQLLKTEAALEALAAGGDAAAEQALIIVKSRHKQGLDQIGDQTNWTQTEAKSLLDVWLAQQAAIEKAERTYGSIAEGLRPRDGEFNGGGGGVTLIVNSGIRGVDYDDDRGDE